MNKPSPKLDPEKYAYLRAEAKHPYRGFRKFFYGAFGISGGVGAVVFFFQILAGKNLSQSVPNFFLQVGVVALMVWLFRREAPSLD